MKLNEAIQLKDLRESKEELIDFPGPLKTTRGRAPKHLYRVMNDAEWNQAQKDGFLAPSKFYGRIHAALDPEHSYGSGNVVVRIKYDPADDWKAKGNLDGDVYAVTDETISLTKVERMR